MRNSPLAAWQVTETWNEPLEIVGCYVISKFGAAKFIKGDTS